ncbi:hypothetical protein [Clostridium grantii]|nr:hypothetical protein [Clostridium grantii]
MKRIKNRRSKIMRRTGLFFMFFFITNIIFCLSSVAFAEDAERQVLSKVGAQVSGFDVEEIDGSEFGISGKVYGGATSNVVIELSTKINEDEKKKVKSALLDGIVSEAVQDGEVEVLKKFKQNINEYEVSVYEIEDYEYGYIIAWSLDFPENYSLVAVLGSDLNSARSEVESIYKTMISEMVNVGIVQDKGTIIIPDEDTAAGIEEENVSQESDKTIDGALIQGEPLDEPIEVCNTVNIAAVQNGPTNPTTFTINESHLLTYIKNYHYNYGQGAPAGTIGLIDSSGNTYGPWEVTIYGELYWEVSPNIILPAETYTIIDSDPSTWSQNSESGGRGMSTVMSTPNFNTIGEDTNEQKKNDDIYIDDLREEAPINNQSQGGVASIGIIPGPENTTESVVGVVVPGVVGVAISVVAGIASGIPPVGGGGMSNPISNNPTPTSGNSKGNSGSNSNELDNKTGNIYNPDKNNSDFKDQDIEKNGNTLKDDVNNVSEVGDVSNISQASVYDFRKNKNNVGIDTSDLEPKSSVENNNEMENEYGIDGFNENGYDKDGFDSRGFDENGYDKDGFNIEGRDKDSFDREGYDLAGYNKKGFDKNGVDRQGYNSRGLDKDGYDREGYDSRGYDKEGFNKQGFDKDGYMADGYNSRAMDREGYYRDGFNTLGYDKEGFNRNGFNGRGYDREGFNQQGYDNNGFNREGYNSNGYDRQGYNSEGYDKFGFDKQGIDKEGYNKEGFDNEGYNREGYDSQGFNKDGYDSQGYDIQGLNKDGFDKEGFDINGLNKEGYDRHGFDKNGYDKEGFNEKGFNNEGYDREGFNAEGFDKNGFDREGFNSEGYDSEGFDREGFDKEGYGRDGYDKDGYNRSGYDKFGVHKDYKKKHEISLADWNKQVKEIQDQISALDKAINDKQARINKLKGFMKQDDNVNGEGSPFDVDTNSSCTYTPTEKDIDVHGTELNGPIANIKEGSTNPFDFTDEAPNYNDEINKLQKEINELKGLKKERMDALKELQDKKPKLPEGEEKPETPEIPEEQEMPDEIEDSELPEEQEMPENSEDSEEMEYPEEQEEQGEPEYPEEQEEPEYPEETEEPNESDLPNEPDESEEQQEKQDTDKLETADDSELEVPEEYDGFPKDGEEKTLIGATDGREYNLKYDRKTGEWINTESGNPFDPDKFEKWQEDLAEDKRRVAEDIEKMQNREDAESERMKFILQLEQAKKAAERNGLTGDEDGRGDVAGELGKILNDITEGKGYDEDKVNQIKKIIKNRINGKTIGKDDYVPFEEEDWWKDTSTMKDSLNKTYKEVVTGTKEDGSMSVLGMGARILIAVGTSGQSEYVLTVAEGMEIVKDGVEKDKSYTEIMTDVVIKVVVDEGAGRIVEGGLGVVVKGAGIVGESAGFIAKEFCPGLTKSAGEIAEKIILTAKKGNIKFSGKLGLIDEKAAKAAVKQIEKQLSELGEQGAKASTKTSTKVIGSNGDDIAENVLKSKGKNNIDVDNSTVNPKQKTTMDSDIEVKKSTKAGSNVDELEVKNNKQTSSTEEPEINKKKEDFYKQHEKKDFDTKTIDETDAEYKKYLEDIEARKNKIIDKAQNKDITKEDILEIKSDPGTMRDVKTTPEEVRKEINKAMNEKIYKPSYDEVREKAVQKLGGNLKDYKVQSVRTPGKKYTLADLNTDNDIVLMKKVMGPDGKLKWEEVPADKWKNDYFEAYGKNTNVLKDGKFDVEMAKGKYKNVDWDSMDDAAKLKKWAEIHGETPTDVFDPEAAVDFSKQNKGILRGTDVSEESILKINNETGTLVDAEGLGKMEQYKVTHYWDKGDVVSQKEALIQLEKMSDLSKSIEGKYNDMIRTGKIDSRYSIKPMSKEMNEGLKIIKNNNLSPTRRDFELRKLGFDGPVDFADKLSIRLEFLKTLKFK